MIVHEEAADAEPPSTGLPAGGPGEEAVEHVMAVSHAPAAAHVAVIGHHTLPYVLALMRRGCAGVRSLRPGTPAPDCEAADLTWIVDLRDDRELDEALRAARWRAGTRGRVVLEGAACLWRRTLATVRDRALRAGLDVVSVDHAASRVVLAPAARLAMAA
jgi:hypothetical protein